MLLLITHILGSKLCGNVYIYIYVSKCFKSIQISSNTIIGSSIRSGWKRNLSSLAPSSTSSLCFTARMVCKLGTQSPWIWIDSEISKSMIHDILGHQKSSPALRIHSYSFHGSTTNVVHFPMWCFLVRPVKPQILIAVPGPLGEMRAEVAAVRHQTETHCFCSLVAAFSYFRTVSLTAFVFAWQCSQSAWSFTSPPTPSPFDASCDQAWLFPGGQSSLGSFFAMTCHHNRNAEMLGV